MAGFEETFQKWLEADLEAKKAAAEPKQPEYVTKTDLGEMFKSFAAELGKTLTEQAEAAKAQVEAVKAEIAEQVEKALPVRPSGAGRVGQESGAGDENAVTPDNVVEYLAQKGRSDAGWSDAEKELVTGIVVGAARQGMKY